MTMASQTQPCWPIPMFSASLNIKNCDQHNRKEALKPARVEGDDKVMYLASLSPSEAAAGHSVILNSPVRSQVAPSCPSLQPYLTPLNSCHTGLFPVPEANQTPFQLMDFILATPSYPLYPLFPAPAQTWQSHLQCASPQEELPKLPKREKQSFLCL